MTKIMQYKGDEKISKACSCGKYHEYENCMCKVDKEPKTETITSNSTKKFGILDDGLPEWGGSYSSNYTLSIDPIYFPNMNHVYVQPPYVVHFTDGSVRNADGSLSGDTKIEYKYKEDEIINDFKAHIDKTYSQHYKTTEQRLECFDCWLALGDASPTFRNTAMKYLWRYGKKNGNNKEDLLKAFHYVLMALYTDNYYKEKE